ncbi:thioesterase II family protein [Nocardia abscessus]|uniref:thioesterase II family protein n=1 Tax=Nocardia abscessus TaxID=120957 RepID=UPI002B4AD6D8|nr:alpha/beta fold hydrolase [Nocardia abscessus]
MRCFHPSPGPRARLVCLPHAGGSASFFLPFSKLLSPEYEVLSIQYPGRQDRRLEPLIDSVDRLSDLIADELGPWLDLPMAFFGHSMGALVAYETARRLEAEGKRVEALFVSGRRAPSRHRDEVVHQYDDERLLKEIRNLNGTDERVLNDPEILRPMLTVIRSDYKAVETYMHIQGIQLSSPIHAHIGLEDARVCIDEAKAWKEHTSGRFELHTHRGGHFYLAEDDRKLIENIVDVLSGETAQPQYFLPPAEGR